MNTTQKTTLVLVGLGAISLAGLTFADATPGVATMTPPLMINGQYHRARGGQIGMMNQFLRTDLTDADKTAITTIQQNYRDSLKTFFQTNSGSLSYSGTLSTDLQSQLQSLESTYITNMTPYIDATKLDTFQQFVTNMKHGFNTGRRFDDGDNTGRGWGKGNMMKERNQGMMPGIQKPSPLPTNISTLLDTKLATFSTNADKITWLNGVNSKIQILLNKVSSQKSKDILAALEDLINQKIDSLNGTGIDQNSLMNLLQ